MTKKNQASSLKNNKEPIHSSANDDSIEETEVFDFINKTFQSHLSKFTAGISPASTATSYFSWMAQLAQAPGTLMELALYPTMHVVKHMQNLIEYSLPANGRDVRFHTDNWSNYPWRLWAEQFLLLEQWFLKATRDVPGLPVPVQRIMAFKMRQLLDSLSPSNFILTNPDLFQETWRSNGMNVLRGLELGCQDMVEKLTGSPPAGVEHFIPGKQVAITQGKVIFKNQLIELLQYEPQTTHVYKEPILILPAWIMKYYILDLQPHNSLVNWLVQQGHSVFIVSWKNPTSKDRNLGLDDYYRMGAMDAIDRISDVMPNRKIHLMGYCLGGTLAMITAAAMAKNNDLRLQSLSLLAAQGDFTEAGELLLFITKSEVSFLKSIMWDQGYLYTKQMAGSFQMLRSYDLIWSKMVQDYMHGTQRGMIDLLAWNADATRMPYKMHSEYLEKLFLNNDFSKGTFAIEGHPIVAENIKTPAFVVSTDKDHVAPWKSVYKTHLMLNTDITFVLTHGGHNAGIVSEPGHPGRRYLMRERKKDDAYIDPKTWLTKASNHDGSWWIAWQQWLVTHSSKNKIKSTSLDSKLPNAPGKYVLQK